MTRQGIFTRYMIKSGLLALALWYGSASAGAMSEATSALQPFTVGSMAEIENHHEGQPFVVALWSLTCPPCMHELEMLSDWHSHNRNIPLVLISVDGQDELEAVAKKLKEIGLLHADSWIYADSYVEKLRFSIDPNWRGELPRSYLYSPPTQRHAISGALTTKTLAAWQAQVAPEQPQQ